ncbi:MAG: hypothetical protein MJ089_08625 [Ruminococcus sp.]|nr:hypothetical protein [Ruminococcus sp.]
MRIVIVENTEDNLQALKNTVHTLLPNALVKGFTKGDEAEEWCNSHSSEVEIYFGNWWGTDEEFDTPEGSTVWKYVDWQKKPLVICTGDEAQFEKWSIRDGADSYISRPVTTEKLRDTLESLNF